MGKCKHEEYEIIEVEEEEGCDLSELVDDGLHEEDVAMANVEINTEVVLRQASSRLNELNQSVRLDREEFGGLLDYLLGQFGFTAVETADVELED